MRLAIFTDSNLHYLDGVARILQELIAYVNRHPEHRLVFFHRDTGATRILEPLKKEHGAQAISYGYRAKCLTVPNYGAYPWFYLLSPKRRILQKVRDFDPDMILTITPYIPRGIGRSALFAARRTSTPVVGSFDLQLSWNSEYYIKRITKISVFVSFLRWFVGIQMHSYSRCAGILVPSHAMMDHVNDTYPRLPASLFPRGVDGQSFNPGKRSKSFRMKHGLTDKVIILFVGRLALEKNLRALARIYKRVKAKRPQAALLLVGEGPERRWYESQGYPDVVFTGALYGDELFTAYASADLFAFSSLAEAGPVVILEAMASGLPVIVPATGGARDSVTEGSTGFVVEDEIQFESRLDELVGDGELRRKMGKEARITAETRSWESGFDRVMDIFRKLAVGGNGKKGTTTAHLQETKDLKE